MSHVTGTTEDDGMRIRHSAQDGTQFKAGKLFISGTFDFAL